ncbi:MAG: PDZ domain-containing protein [Luteitalea sp.]|nr:PDZ domain-containing protein [Luteitalea sp.]
MRITSRHCFPLIAIVILLVGLVSWAQTAPAAIEYRVSFPEPEHRWMLVEVTFPDVSAETLEVRMSRASPGRYAAHDFAKNVFMERFTDGRDAPVTVTRPNPHQWNVEGHDETVKVSYRIFGDRVDGTYLAIDETHAHINMPAAFMWARGLADRPIRITFVPPTGKNWRAATQLFSPLDPSTDDDHTFTAPNLQYFMDSPTELSSFALREFRISVRAGGPETTIRVALHHAGTEAELDRFTADVQKIVREQRAVWGELPEFEPGSYTFIADYLPYASGDGMEHRNSTILTSSQSLAQAHKELMGTVSHELFHAWNVERVRPASLEPFDFEDMNISDELWLAEGFTNYYGALALVRAGVIGRDEGMAHWANVINGALHSPGTAFRSAVDMSRLAPLVDRAVAADRTNWENTFHSYYTFGEALALGLDLTLRARTNSRVTLDDFMRAMWTTYGKPGGRAPGLVAKPYTLADAQARLAEVSGDPQFAADFFTRYIQGTEKIDYASLVERGGYQLQRADPERATLGIAELEVRDEKVLVTQAPPTGSPAYLAGLNRDDVLVSIDGQTIGAPDEVTKVVHAHKPGDEVRLVYESRAGRVERTVKLVEDPRLTIVPVESTDGTLSETQQAFRDAWLSSKANGK